MYRAILVALSCLGCFFSLTPAYAQTQALPSHHAPNAVIVDDIVVEGLGRIDKEAALTGVKHKRHHVLDIKQVTQDIHAIFATGLFDDVQAQLLGTGASRTLSFVVKEKPTVGKIIFVGRHNVGEDDIKGAISVRTHALYTAEQIHKDQQKLRELYVQKGYYLAEVNAVAKPVEGNKDVVDVTFEFIEGQKVKVGAITFVGNTCIASQTLLSNMQTRVGNELSFLTQSGTYKEDDLETDVMRLQAVYLDQGFVMAKVAQPEATLSPDRRSIEVVIGIEEGPRFVVGDISFAGALDLEAQKDVAPEKRRHKGLKPLAQGQQDLIQKAVDINVLRAQLSEKTGETFSRSRLFADLQAVTDVYRDRGYAFANVTPNSHVDAEKKQVDIELQVEKGDLVTLSRIDIAGNTRTRDKVIRRELVVFEGERFSQSKLNTSRARIYQLGYFESVNMVTEQGKTPNTMQVVIEVKEKSTGTFQVGAGFSSIERFIATAQVSQNNFLGNGQSLSLSAQLSFGEFARQLASLQLFEPYFLDTPFSLGFAGYLQQRYFRDFQRNAIGVAPTLGYPLTHELRLSTGFTVEKVEITTGNAAVDAVFSPLDRQGLVAGFNFNLSFDSRDNRLFPRRGMFHEARFDISSPHLGASSNMAFMRSDLTLRFYRPVVWGIVFRVNMQMGYIFNNSSTTVPISERYFPGGIYSVRGFAPRALGPARPVANDIRDPHASTRDFIWGGDKQAILNLELEFPLVEVAGLRGVVFFDAGNAFSEEESLFFLGMSKPDRQRGYLLSSNRLVQVPLGMFSSFGFGVRWLSPIGPLRFEWGIPITKKQPYDRDIIFEFTIGNFF